MSTPDYIRRSQNNYNAKFDIIQIKAPKGTKKRITTLSGQSMAAFCLQCVLDRLDELERSETAPEHEQPANTPTDSKNENTTVTEAQTEKKPLTDDELADILKEKGYPIARRTVAKYRQQLNIPVARLRK